MACAKTNLEIWAYLRTYPNQTDSPVGNSKIHMKFKLSEIANSKKNLSIFLFSLVAGLLILTRREFVAVFVLSSLYLFLFFKIPIKKIILIILITLITTSPYLIRNIVIYIYWKSMISYPFFNFNSYSSNFFILVIYFCPYSNIFPIVIWANFKFF